MSVQSLHPMEHRCPGKPDDPTCAVCVRRLQIDRDKALRYTAGPGLVLHPAIDDGNCRYHIEFRMPL
jgi:hypothetical protein